MLLASSPTFTHLQHHSNYPNVSAPLPHMHHFILTKAEDALLKVENALPKVENALLKVEDVLLKVEDAAHSDHLPRP